MTDGAASTPTGGSSRPTPRARHRHRGQPNYAARRMLATTIAIAAVVAAGVLGWRAVRGDSSSSPGPSGEWNEIALVERSTGEVTTLDSEGVEIATDVGLGRVGDVYTDGGRVILVGADQIVIVGPDADPITIAIERGSVVTPVTTSEGLHLAVGRPAGGDVVLIDTTTGDVLDVGALADQSDPLLFVETLRWADDGSAFAVADAANFQTIVVQPGVEAATFLPDQPLAVGDELVATSQTVGRQADVALLDLDRRNRATVPAEIPAGGVMVGERLVMVSIDGTISRVEPGHQEAEHLGDVTVPSGATVRAVHPTADGDRLVVVGGTFEAVVDLDGHTTFSTTFTSPVEIGAPGRDWTCLPVGGTESAHSIIALDSGEQLADLTGLSITAVSADGCTVMGERAGVTEIVTADGSALLGRVRAAWLAPDGRTVVSTDTTGRTQLVQIDGDLRLGDPIDLSDLAPSNLAVAFLDR